MKIKKNNYITFLCFFISINETYNFNCGANKLRLKPLNLNNTHTKDKRSLQLGYKPIKIGIDYTSFSKPNSMSNSTFNNIKSLIESTTNEFQKFLRVQHTNFKVPNITDLEEACQVNKISDKLQDLFYYYDIVIFPIFTNQFEKGILAGAGFCMTVNLGQNLLRPVAGSLLINQDIDFDSKNVDMYIKNIIFHEITHILVFSHDLLIYLGMTTTINNLIYINSKEVLSRAKMHFNCNSLKGLPLEDQGENGSVGSHWEARYMLGDYMNSVIYIDNVISDITLALFEDTGFYQVEYYSGGLFKFGKNSGCIFLNEKCIFNGNPISDEFCIVEGQPKCSKSKLSKGYCGIYDYSLTGITIPSKYRYFSNSNYGGYEISNFCPVSETYYSSKDYFPYNCKVGTSTLNKDFGEIIGNNSFCFISSLLPSGSNYKSNNQAICYQIECDRINKQIIVHVGSSIINCPTFGGLISNISGFKGSINCPKYIDICSFDNNNICNEMFDCLTKQIKTDQNSYINESNSNSYDDLNFWDMRLNSSNNYIHHNIFIIISILYLIIL